MITPKRIVHVVAALGLAAGALVTTSSGAAVAATPTCNTGVIGVTSTGRVIHRAVTNTSVKDQVVSAAPLPFSVSNMLAFGSDQITGGLVIHLNTFTAGGRPRNVDLTEHDGSAEAGVEVADVYVRGLSARLVAGSGRFYVYAVDGHGRLKRWTRERDSAGNIWFDSPKLIARHMGGLKTLSYSWTYKIDGRWRDFLYATTKGGALKQLQIPWRKPAQMKVHTIKKAGFKSYTGLSLSFCNNSPKYLSIIAIDRVNNRARWYTMTRALTPRGSNVVRRGPVAPGYDWRLHATF